MPQSLAQIHCHVIFSTKNRDPFLNDKNFRNEMHAYLASVLRQYDSPAIIIGGTSDHVHILCSIARTHALAKVVGEAKRNSSKWAKTKGGKLSKFQWQNGYGAFSVSHSNVPRVRAYIAEQEKHHRKMTFQDELRGFFRKHGIQFDERYVWD